MKEPIRLVIWDLDETFWKGTLSEEGHEILAHNIEIVKTLAQRGIMNSICSKNDFDVVKAVLSDLGVWDYFIFPSINWDSKGPRIKKIVENVQLRPESILFIDDNPMNLNEAKHFVEGLQISDEKIIPKLLSNAFFKGKDDKKLSRLAQYRLLEKKREDEDVVGDNEDFLRISQISVSFVDPRQHIDRVIELINRTNQLNFTKKRVSENIDIARREVQELLNDKGIEAKLLHVVDKYGDYGLVGFYALDCNENSLSLKHFCFSCRTLNMGIETWLYQRLNKPELQIVGDVLTDVVGDERQIDWVEEKEIQTREEDSGFILNRLILKGGCEQLSFSHFFTKIVKEVVGEFNTKRYGMAIRSDHSVFIRYAAEGVSDEFLGHAKRIGYDKSDFDSQLFSKIRNGGAETDFALLSFWTDARYDLYRHKETGAVMPIAFPRGSEKDPDAIKIRTVVDAEYERVGLIDEESFKENLRIGFSKIDPHIRTAILLARDVHVIKGRLERLEATRLVNQWIRTVVAEFKNIQIFDISNYFECNDDAIDETHFKRPVYYRLFQDFMIWVAKSRLDDLDKKSLKSVINTHKKFSDYLLVSSGATMDMFALLCGHQASEEALVYAQAIERYDKKDTEMTLRRKVELLTLHGFHENVGNLIRSVPFGFKKFRMKKWHKKCLGSFET